MLGIIVERMPASSGREMPLVFSLLPEKAGAPCCSSKVGGASATFFPKASPMLGFSFRFSFAAEGAIRSVGRRWEGRKEGRKEGREEGEEKEGKEEGRKGGRKGGSGREGRKGGRKEGREAGRGSANSLRRASLGRSESTLDGDETVEITCGELRREGARQHTGRGRERDSMLDG